MSVHVCRTLAKQFYVARQACNRWPVFFLQKAPQNIADSNLELFFLSLYKIIAKLTDAVSDKRAIVYLVHKNSKTESFE